MWEDPCVKLQEKSRSFVHPKPTVFSCRKDLSHRKLLQLLLHLLFLFYLGGSGHHATSRISVSSQSHCYIALQTSAKISLFYIPVIPQVLYEH